MFYRFENDELIYGPSVTFPDSTFLLLEFKDTYTYPVEGWYYFETEEEAKVFFNIE